jgi:4,5-dihydroxyphthalate decarboxylase
MISPDSQAPACPLSGRISTYRPVQNSEATSQSAQHRDRERVTIGLNGARDRRVQPISTALVGGNRRRDVARQSRWVIGGIDFPIGPIDFVPHPVPTGVEVEWVGTDVDLGAMLEGGEIDASLISADAPKAILEGSPKVGRLFEDYEVVERDYYRRTGIFPIMHTVVVTRELADEHPNLVKAVYRAFCTAKDRMQEQYVKGMTFNNMSIMLPWFSNLIDEDRALLGDDWWPYGIQRNRSAIDVVLRYHHEQGLTKRRLTIEDVFFPDLLDS